MHHPSGRRTVSGDVCIAPPAAAVAPVADWRVDVPAWESTTEHQQTQQTGISLVTPPLLLLPWVCHRLGNPGM